MIHIRHKHRPVHYVSVYDISKLIYNDQNTRKEMEEHPTQNHSQNVTKRPKFIQLSLTAKKKMLLVINPKLIFDIQKYKKEEENASYLKVFQGGTRKKMNSAKC